MDLSGVSFTDDVPSITADTGVDESGVTLTTADANTEGVASDTDTASFASAFAAAAAADGDYGADGAGTITVGSYALSLASGVSDGDASGLESSGNAVLLRENGDDIEGYYGTTVVFSLSVDAATGVVTLTQNEALDHDDAGTGTGTDLSLVLADDLVSLSGVATITDSEGDTDTATYSVDLSGVSFTDDVPSITADTGVDESGVTLTTADANTEGVASDTDTASFASAFAAAAAADGDYGADGAGTITVGSYALSLASGVSDGDASGLESSGNAVLLRENGDDIEGYYGTTVVFSLSVDAATGVVTLTQNEALDHDDAGTGTGTDLSLVLADDLVSLSGVATITDSEGDTDTATYSVDLSGVSFTDDVPEINGSAPTADSLQVDETDLTTDSTEDFSGNFSAAAGADGQASLVYSLTISSTGVDSGVATTAGNSVFLYMDGNDVVGLEGSGTSS